MKHPEQAPVLIVGAGIAGLSCARALADSGLAVKVLERARGVGGRCATRRMEGQPVDFGLAFFHGRSPDFLAALEEVPATRLPGWPITTTGGGRPCQAEAFTSGEHRLAFQEGVQAFPKYLARDLPIELQANLTGLEIHSNRIHLTLADGRAMESPIVVLALAPEQALAQLEPLAQFSQVASARAVLGLVRSQTCLTVRALYPAQAPVPSWDMLFPETSSILQVIAHDSAKRQAPAHQALVFQAHPAWSRRHMETPAWPGLLLQEAARLLGPWATCPLLAESHCWEYARSDRSAELAQPMLLELPGATALGLSGDRFAPGGGVEAAWLSGKLMARRILARELP